MLWQVSDFVILFPGSDIILDSVEGEKNAGKPIDFPIPLCYKETIFPKRKIFCWVQFGRQDNGGKNHED